MARGKNDMRHIILFIVSGFILIFSSSPVLGAQFTFSPRLSITEEYTDNLFLTEDDNNKEEEFITIISAGFTAAITGKNSGLEISYDPAYSIYDEFTEFNAWRHDADLFAWIDLTKNSRIELRDTFLRTEDPYTEEDYYEREESEEAEVLEEDPTIRTSREPYYRNIASLKYINRFGVNDSFFIAYTHELLENEDVTLEDNDRHTPSAGLINWFTPQWGLESEISYTKTEYDREPEYTGSPSEDFERYYGTIKLIRKFTRHLDGFIAHTHTYTDFEGREVDYQIYNPSVGIEYIILENISLSLEVGYFVKDTKDIGDDDTGWTGNGELIKTLKRGSISLTGSVGYYETFYGAENLGISQFYAAGSRFEYELVQDLTLNIFGSYRHDRYIDIIPERRDRAAIGGIGLSYTYREWLSLSLEYSHRIVNSTIDENDYRENRVVFRIEIEPPQPYRLLR